MCRIICEDKGNHWCLLVISHSLNPCEIVIPLHDTTTGLSTLCHAIFCWSHLVFYQKSWDSVVGMLYYLHYSVSLRMWVYLTMRICFCLLCVWESECESLIFSVSYLYLKWENLVKTKKNLEKKITLLAYGRFRDFFGRSAHAAWPLAPNFSTP